MILGDYMENRSVCRLVGSECSERGHTSPQFYYSEEIIMTQSFILMAVGIGIGYTITLWLQRLTRPAVAAIGPVTEMQSSAHEAISSGTDKVGIWDAVGAMDRLVRESGAEVVMLVDGNGELMVVDVETGTALRQFVDAEHDGHPAEIWLNEQGEPVLYDKQMNEPIVVHEKPCDKPFRVPVPKSHRYLAANVIYFWRYQGSHNCCVWTGGKLYVRRRR
jgi:hypothetical protein